VQERIRDRREKGYAREEKGKKVREGNEEGNWCPLPAGQMDGEAGKR